MWMFRQSLTISTVSSRLYNRKRKTLDANKELVARMWIISREEEECAMRGAKYIKIVENKNNFYSNHFSNTSHGLASYTKYEDDD